MQTAFTRHAGVEVPLICGAMYPCSNPELVAAVSAAGGLGVVQPLSLTYVHGHDLREGLRLIYRLIDEAHRSPEGGAQRRPRAAIGFNAIVEQSSKVYEDRMRKAVAVALEEGVRFFITALGNPRWVVEAVHGAGGVVYHDVTERKWAEKALEGGVDGLICVNKEAGGHAGQRDPRALFDELSGLGVPLVCAGGVGDPAAFRDALALGYAACQLGTRFIATTECTAHDDYKQAIVRAEPDDIVLTERISGVPVAVINTPYVRAVGTRAGRLGRLLLKGRKTKHWMRLFYSLRSVWQLKRASLQGTRYQDYFQAGRSVGGIEGIEPAGEVVRRFARALEPSPAGA